MSALLDLAAQCEAAEGADRALDGVAHILANLDKPWIVGHEPGRFPQKPIHGTLSDYLEWVTGLCDSTDPVRRADVADSISAPAYTASLDAAMSLVPEGFNFGCGLDTLGLSPGEHPAWAWSTDRENFTIVRAATPALALCAASLRAREASK